MRARVAVVGIALSACGRVGFDLLADGAIDARPAALSAGDVRLIYDIEPTGGTVARTFDHASSTWSAAVTATPATTSDVVRWSVPRVSPIDGSELIAIASTNGAATTLEIVRGPDGAFAPTVSISALPLATFDKRGFDLAYEAHGGTAVVAYTDGTPSPKVRRLSADGTTWSAEVAVPSSGGAPVSWIELESRAGTDELALVYADEAGILWALTETAGTWDAAPTQLETVLRTTNWQAFAAAYESLSGDLLVVWGHTTGGAMGTFWSTKLADQPVFSTGVMDPLLFGGGVFTVAPEAGTDRIVIGLDEYSCQGGGCDDVWGAVWDGVGMTQQTDLDLAIGAANVSIADEYGSRAGSRPVGVSWLGTTGTAVLVWGCATYALPPPQQCDSTLVDSATWSPVGGWQWVEFTTTPAVMDKSSIALVNLGDSVLAVFTDLGSNVWAKRAVPNADPMSHVTWSDTEGGAALTTSTGVLVDQPFGIARR